MLIEGWASTDKIDHALDKVLPSAFDRSIAEYGFNGPRGIKLLAQHNQRMPIGVITLLQITNSGLWIEGEIDESISYAGDLAKAIKANSGLSYSIGYRLKESGTQFVDDGLNSHFLITELDLFEVSVVTFPCNDDCHLLLPKSAQERISDSVAAMKRLQTPTNYATKIGDSVKQMRAVMKERS